MIEHENTSHPDQEPTGGQVFRRIAVDAESRLGIPVAAIVTAWPDIPNYVKYPVGVYLAYRVFVRGPQNVPDRIITHFERRRGNGESPQNRPPQR